MRVCGRRGLVLGLVTCVVDPSACFLHGAGRTRLPAIRRPTASCSPRATPSDADVEHVEHRPKDLDQDVTPLVDALAEAASNVRSPLFYPGHKMGRYDGAAWTRITPHRTFHHGRLLLAAVHVLPEVYRILYKLEVDNGLANVFCCTLLCFGLIISCS